MPNGFFPGLSPGARAAENSTRFFAPPGSVQQGTQMGRNPLESLSVIAANEGRFIDDRLGRELGGIQDTVDRVGEQDAVGSALAASKRSSELDEAQFERSTRTFDLSDRQKKSAATRQTLRRKLNRASAGGAVRRGFADRSKAAAAVGGSFGDALFSQRVSGTTTQASVFTGEQSARAQEDAARTSSTIGTVASIAGAALAFFSSEKLKHDHGHEDNLLKKLKKVRVNRWQYKGDSETHVGPFSEEFNREFDIDTKRPDMISVIDALGVTMGAIKELDKKVEARG